MSGNVPSINQPEPRDKILVTGQWLTKREIMARALGLPGCDCKEDPFKHFKRTYLPKKEGLFEECKRRMAIKGLEIGRRNRWEYPSSAWSSDDLAAWLRKNVTQNDEEAKELMVFVEIFRKDLLAQNVSQVVDPPPNDTLNGGVDATRMLLCEDYYLRQTADDRPIVLIAMAIGLSSCKVELDAVLPWCTTLVKKQTLLAEAQRRHWFLPSSSDHPRPGANWKKGRLMVWLQNHPIQGDKDIDFVYTQLNATNYGLDTNQQVPAPPPHHDHSNARKQGPDNNSDTAELETAANPRIPIQPSCTSEEENALNRGNQPEHSSVEFDAQTLMAKGLGLPGCHFEESPFNQHKRRCTPNRQVLYRECQRRLEILGIKLNRANRTSFPNSKSSRKHLVLWLERNPIQEEGNKILQLVTDLKKKLGSLDPDSEAVKDASSSMAQMNNNKKVIISDSTKPISHFPEAVEAQRDDSGKREDGGGPEVVATVQKAWSSSEDDKVSISSAGKTTLQEWDCLNLNLSDDECSIFTDKYAIPERPDDKTFSALSEQRYQNNGSESTAVTTSEGPGKEEKTAQVFVLTIDPQMIETKESSLRDSKNHEDDERKMSPCEKYFRQQPSQDQPMVVFLMAIGLVCCQGMVTSKLQCDQDPIKPNEQELAKEAQRRHRIRDRRLESDTQPEPAWGVDGLMRWLQGNPIEGGTNIEFVRRTVESTYPAHSADADVAAAEIGTFASQDRSLSNDRDGGGNGSKQHQPLQRSSEQQRDIDKLSRPDVLFDVGTHSSVESNSLLDENLQARSVCSTWTYKDTIKLDETITTLSLTESDLLESDSDQEMMECTSEENCDGGIGSTPTDGHTTEDVDGLSSVATLHDTSGDDKGGDIATKTASISISPFHEIKLSAEANVGFTSRGDERGCAVKAMGESFSSRSEAPLLPASDNSMDASSLADSVMKMSVSSFGADSGSKTSTADLSSSNPSTLSSSRDSSRLTANSEDLNRMRGGGAVSTVVEGEAVIIGLNEAFQTHFRETNPQEDESVSTLRTSSSLLQLFSEKNVKDMVLRDKQGRIGNYTGACSRFRTFRRAPHGHGEMKYHSDGTTYKGEWSKGVWDGEGVWSHPDGRKYSGETSMVVVPNTWLLTICFVGSLVGGKFHGSGTHVFSDGRVYEGEFKDGRGTGYCKCYHQGHTYVGKREHTRSDIVACSPDDFAQNKGTTSRTKGMVTGRTLGRTDRCTKDATRMTNVTGGVS